MTESFNCCCCAFDQQGQTTVSRVKYALNLAGRDNVFTIHGIHSPEVEVILADDFL